MTRNAGLFEKIAARIEEEPDRYDQAGWAQFVTPEGEKDTVVGGVGPASDPLACGTSHCIAGWAVELTEGTRLVPGHAAGEVTMIPRTAVLGDLGVWSDRAREALGLSAVDGDYLFCASWGEDVFENAHDVADALRKIGRGEADPKDFATPPSFA